LKVTTVIFSNEVALLPQWVRELYCRPSIVKFFPETENILYCYCNYTIIIVIIFFGKNLLCKRAIWKVSSSKLLTKQAMRKKLFYTKNMYILKLHLSVVIVGINTLVSSGNKFLYACVKEICRLWAQLRFDTFHQLVIIVEALW
jgi:hypothetical protein